MSAWNSVTYTAEAVINISMAARLTARNRATVRRKADLQHLRRRIPVLQVTTNTGHMWVAGIRA